MDIDAITKWLGGEWAVIAHAPFSFIASVIIVGFVIWRASQWQFSTRIENLRGALVFRDDKLKDYEDKLSGATPDEAKARQDALEARVNELTVKIAALGPKIVTFDQQQKMTSVLQNLAKKEVMISTEAVSISAISISKGLIRAFECANWKVNNSQFWVYAGAPPQPRTGISLLVENTTQLTPEQKCISTAFNAAGLDFDLQQIPQLTPGSWPTVQIRLTTAAHD